LGRFDFVGIEAHASFDQKIDFISL
jgi:hypothetical protein